MREKAVLVSAVELVFCKSPDCHCFVTNSDWKAGVFRIRFYTLRLWSIEIAFSQNTYYLMAP